MAYILYRLTNNKIWYIYIYIYYIDFDTSCFSGEYITDDITPEYLNTLETQRGNGRKGATGNTIITTTNTTNSNSILTPSTSKSNLLGVLGGVQPTPLPLLSPSIHSHKSAPFGDASPLHLLPPPSPRNGSGISTNSRSNTSGDNPILLSPLGPRGDSSSSSSGGGGMCETLHNDISTKVKLDTAATFL